MRKLALAFALLLLPIVARAQRPTELVQIKVRRLTLVGAPQISQAEQQQIASEIKNMNLSITSVEDISERLRYALQERGFFKALAAPPDVTVVSSSPSEEVIDAKYHVDLGRQYRLKEIAFSNVSSKKTLAFPATELRQAFPISDEEIFNVERIRVGLENLRQLYASQGYINFTPVPNVDADDSSGLVSLRVDLDEGSAFRIGALVLDGVEPVAGSGAKLLQAWKQYEGQIYSDQLTARFMQENAAYLAPNATIRCSLRQDAEHHVVNFILEFDEHLATN